MSDLAPFVAATLRDKVVEDMQKEIEELRKKNRELQRKLQERDPNRSVAFKVRTVDESHVHTSLEERTVSIVNAFGHGREFRRLFDDIPPLLHPLIKLKHIQQFEVWIDGASAIRCHQLEFRYCMYKYETQQEEYGKYVAVLRASSGQDFKLEIEVLDVPPEEHAALLGLPSPVDFPPPDEPESHNFNAPAHHLAGGVHRMWPFERSERFIPSDRVMQLLGEKNICIDYREIKCTKDFFFDHLTIPYDSQGVE